MNPFQDRRLSTESSFRNSMTYWRDGIFFFAVLVLAAFLRIVSYGGSVGSDDLAYAQLAHELPTGTSPIAPFHGAPIFRSRIGIIAPTAIAFRLVGVSESALAMYSFVLSLASIILVFLAARMFFNKRVGYIAAALQAFIPLDVRNSTLCLPDLPAAFWANVGLLLLYLASKQPQEVKKGSYGVLAGLALGVSWLCKEAILFSLPFVALYLAWLIYETKRNISLAAALVSGAALVLVLESVFYHFYVSDPFYHFGAIERNNQWTYSAIWFWSPTAPWSALLLRLFRDGPMAILLNTEFGFVTSIALLGVAYAAFRKESSALFVSLWFLYHILIFNFGSHSIQSYMPLPIAGWPRYLYPVILPAVLLVAALLDSLLPARRNVEASVASERAFWGTALVLVLVLGAMHGLYRNIKDSDVSRVERKVANMISPDTVLYTDARTAWVLSFFWSYPDDNRTVDFSGMEWAEIPEGSYVLLNPRSVEIISHYYGYKPPSFYYRPPPTWVLEWQGSSAALFRVPNS